MLEFDVIKSLTYSAVPSLNFTVSFAFGLGLQLYLIAIFLTTPLCILMNYLPASCRVNTVYRPKYNLTIE